MEFRRVLFRSESLDDIPEDIVEEWNLAEMLEEREEWENEDE